MESVMPQLEEHLLKAAKIVEDEIDAEIEKLERLDEDELEELKNKRLEALKKQASQKQEWLTKGHGEYSELATEKDFFTTCKASNNVVCHFYRDSTFRCKIVDKHLAILAPKHLETKFCKINAEKSPFLTQRLKIRVLPTILLSKDAKTRDFIVGFDDLGGIDEFSTEMLEWRLARANVIIYHGDLLVPPDSKVVSKHSKNCNQQKTIRGSTQDSSDDDD